MSVPAVFEDHYLFTTMSKGTHDLGRPMRSMPVEDALAQQFVRNNPMRTRNHIVVDLDNPAGYLAVQRAVHRGLAQPNYLLQNKATRHFHVGWFLTEPVTFSDAARPRPQAFFRDVQHRLTASLPEGDHAYKNYAMRGPLFPGHELYEVHSSTFTLADLMDSTRPLVDTTVTRTGFGTVWDETMRNQSLFDALRTWAYPMRANFTDRTQWRKAVFLRGKEINARFAYPLSDSELNSTCKSVEGWVWTRYTGGSSEAANRAREIGLAVRREKAEETKKKIVFLRSQGWGRHDIAEHLGIKVSALDARLSRMRKEGWSV